MTTAEFLREVRRLHGWLVTPAAGLIRRNEQVLGFACQTCPLAAVSNALVGTRLTLESKPAAFALGIAEDLRVAIVNAADGQPSDLRKDLLAACKLTEAGAEPAERR